MSARRLAVALLGAGVLGGGATARAEIPHVRAEACPNLDASALDAAVGRELSLDATHVRAAGPLAIEIACPDGVHARVHMAAGASAVSRDLDLSEEPDALRVKFVALAVAEMVDTIDAQQPPQPLAAAAPFAPPPRTLDTEDVPPPIVLVQQPPAAPPAGITVRGGLRLIAGDQDPLPTLSADLAVGPVRIGLAAAIGEGHRWAGMPYILGATLARTLVCTHAQTALCLVARGELGFAGVSTHADDTTIMQSSVYSMYGDLELGFEVRRAINGWHWVASLDLGAADGLVIEAQPLERLDGPFAIAATGLSW